MQPSRCALITKRFVSALLVRPVGRHLALSQLKSVQVLLAEHIKLLGVTLDGALSFEKHIFNACSSFKALRRTCLRIDIAASKSMLPSYPNPE